jgi:DNA primase
MRQYLIKRGVDRKSWEEFKLGFAPDSWDALLKHLLSKGGKKEILINAGLARVSEEGKCYDWFRNRLTFPVTDMRGRVLGFGARLIEDSTSKNDFQPKYINTRETEVFSKGNVLFGMNMTANAIRDAKEVILVEGYMDTIVLFQHGICNVASVSGTALTPEQVRLLHRYTEKLVMLYDGDAAGESANLRGMEVSWEEGLEVRVACLPPGDDPDEYVIKYGKAGLLEKVSCAEDFFDYRFRLLLRQHGDKDINQKLRVCREMWPSISRIKNLIGRSEYIKKLAEKLSLKEQDVMKEFIRDRKSVKTRFAPGQPEEIRPSYPEGNGVAKAERMLTAIMLEETWRARDVKKILTPVDFQSPDMRLLAEEIFRMADNGQEVPVAAVISSLRDRVDPGVISALLLEAGEIIDREKTMEDCIKKLKGWPEKKRRAELPPEIDRAKRSGNNELAKNLLIEYTALMKNRG